MGHAVPGLVGANEMDDFDVGLVLLVRGDVAIAVGGEDKEERGEEKEKG